MWVKLTHLSLSYILPNLTLLYLLFFYGHTVQTDLRICTLNGSNDAAWAKYVPFEGIALTQKLHLGSKILKNPQFPPESRISHRIKTVV
jgi:hypothetical protein